MTFKFNTGTKLISLDEMFNPWGNPLVQDLITIDQVKKWLKELFDHNGQDILRLLGNKSDYNKKFFKMIEDEMPSNKWYGVTMLGKCTTLKTKIGFGNITGDWSGNAGLPGTFITKFEELRKSWSYDPSSLPSPYQELMYFCMRSITLSSRGSSLYVNNILQMKSEGQKFDVKIDGVWENEVLKFNSGKVTVMVTDEDRRSLYRLFEYSTNPIDIIGERPWTDVTEGDVPIYGVELEVSTDYSVEAIVNAFPNVFAICKKDSSITGNKPNMYEIVTIPASLRKHKRNWLGFDKNTNEDMFDTSDKHNNGMHIHIDRKAFDHEAMHLKRFSEFFINPTNQKFLKEISERDDNSHNSYAKFISPKMKAAVSIIGFDTAGKAITQPRPGKTTYSPHASDQAWRSGDKNSVINLAHTKTVEVRLFKGVANVASILKNLEFVDAVYLYSKYNPFSEMLAVAFIRWLNNLPKSQYRNLRLCLTDLDLDKIIFEGSILEKVTKLDAKGFVSWLNTQNFDKKLYDFIFKTFNDKFQKVAVKLKNENGVFSLLRETTKYSKFSDQIRNWYNH